MKISTYNNRTCVTFNLTGFGNELTEQYNLVTALANKHMAQSMLFNNKSNWNTDNKGNFTTPTIGNIGGTITFHSHSCNHSDSTQELINLVSSFGDSKIKYFKEIIETHRIDGSPYKKPQYRIVEA